MSNILFLSEFSINGSLVSCNWGSSLMTGAEDVSKY